VTTVDEIWLVVSMTALMLAWSAFYIWWWNWATGGDVWGKKRNESEDQILEGWVEHAEDTVNLFKDRHGFSPRFRGRIRMHLKRCKLYMPTEARNNFATKKPGRRTSGGRRIRDVSDPEIRDGLEPLRDKDADL